MTTKKTVNKKDLQRKILTFSLKKKTKQRTILKPTKN